MSKAVLYDNRKEFVENKSEKLFDSYILKIVPTTVKDTHWCSEHKYTLTQQIYSAT